MSTDAAEKEGSSRPPFTTSTSVRNLVGFFKELEDKAAKEQSNKSKRLTTNLTSPLSSPRGHKPASLTKSSGEILSARGPNRSEIVTRHKPQTSQSLDVLDLSMPDGAVPIVKFNTNPKFDNRRQSDLPHYNDIKQNPAEEKNTTDTRLNGSGTIEQTTKSPSNSSITVPNETNIDEGKKSKDKEKKDKERDVIKDTDVDHMSAYNTDEPNRASVRFDVKPLPNEEAFNDEDDTVGIKQSASGSAVQSPTTSLVDSPSFISLPDETRKRRSRSRGTGRVEKTSTDSVKKDIKESARSRSKSKSEGSKDKKKTDGSPESGYSFKRREDVEKDKEAKKKKKEEEERKKKEEEEAKKKKKEEEERKKKEEKEAAKKVKSERRKSRKGLVPSLSIKGKDKDVFSAEPSSKTLTSRDSKDDLHIRSKSSVAEERGGLKSKKSMPSLKIKSISPRGERKGSNPPLKESASKTSSESSSTKPSPIQIPSRDVEPRSEPAVKTDRPITRGLHRSVSTENVEKQTRNTARNAPEPPPIPTPDGAASFRVRKRSLSTNELKGDGTDQALTSTEPISIGKMAIESKQREDTYVNILKKSIREILLGTNTKIEREELTKIRYEEEVSSSEEEEVEDKNIWEEPEDSEKNIRYDTRDETLNQLLLRRAAPTKEGSRSLEIRCATLNKLVERLTFADYSVDDKVFMRIFLATFESFTTPQILFTKLRQRFAVPSGKYSKIVEQQIQTRVCTVMKYWIDNYPSRKLTKPMIARFRDFIKTELKEQAYKPLRDILDQSLNKRIETNRLLRERVRIDMTTDIIPPSLASNTKVYDPVQYFTEEDIASQITYVDYEVYNAVQPWEIIRQIWRSPMTTRSPIKEMIQRFNSITNWALVSILSQNTPKARAQLYSKFVKIAKQLREMNNFNGVMAIIGALNNKAITRLTQTKSLLSKRTQKALEKLDQLLNMRGNFRSYRDLLSDLDPPAIPFMGLILSDYTFIVDGNVSTVDGMINFAQRKLMWTNCLELVMKFQNASETDVPQHWAAERLIAKTPQWTDELAFERSCAIEPDGESVRRDEVSSISILAAKTTERSTSTENNERSEDLALSSSK